MSRFGRTACLVTAMGTASAATPWPVTAPAHATGAVSSFQFGFVLTLAFDRISSLAATEFVLLVLLHGLPESAELKLLHCAAAMRGRIASTRMQ